VNVAVVLQTDNSEKKCRQGRIAVGAIAASPLRAQKAEMYLSGKAVSDRLFEETAELTAKEIMTVSHHGYSRTFLKEILKIQTKRALETAYNRARAINKGES